MNSYWKCVLENRLKLLEETREIYYGPNFEPLETRADLGYDKEFKYNKGSAYKTDDGRMCSIGRIWSEMHGLKHIVSSSKRKRMVLELAERDGLFYEDIETLEWLQNLQNFHDFPNDAKEIYKRMYSMINIWFTNNKF